MFDMHSSPRGAHHALPVRPPVVDNDSVSRHEAWSDARNRTRGSTARSSPSGSHNGCMTQPTTTPSNQRVQREPMAGPDKKSGVPLAHAEHTSLKKRVRSVSNVREPLAADAASRHRSTSQSPRPHAANRDNSTHDIHQGMHLPQARPMPAATPRVHSRGSTARRMSFIGSSGSDLRARRDAHPRRWLQRRAPTATAAETPRRF